MIGSTISHYRIVAELGRGGMGIVYKAEDTKLNRTVALKVLPRQALEGEEETSRFGLEAQAAAALNHPHIATVYEIDEVDGQSFIVMEYVDGPSLQEKIDEGPLKLDVAINLAIQIVDGLSAAHERGIIHRDVKPANIMLTGKGEAKIMDFGLAKLSGKTTLTKTGMTLGTATFMSPEQARGERVDYRSDIFSLGAVLYEMLTGRPAFKGEYAEAVVYSILNVDPDPITSVRSGVPMELERIVDKALAKNPEERYQHMDEMGVDLQTLQKKLPSIQKGSSSATRTLSVGQPTPWRRSIPWGVAGLMIVIAVVALWQPWASSRTVSSRIMRVPITLPPGETLVGPGSAVEISRDGMKLAYVAEKDDTTRLYIRLLDEFESRAIPGTEHAYSPFFSPDGNWVGFFADGYLKKVYLQGGRPQTLSVAAVADATWGRDDNIIFSGGSNVGLWRVSASGDSREALTTVDKNFEQGEYFQFGPQMLPGAEAVLFTSRGVGADSNVSVFFPETGERRNLIVKGSNARYVPAGYLVYTLASDLLAVRFDLNSLTVSGSSIPVVEGIRTEMTGFFETAHYSLSDNGTLVYVQGRQEGADRSLVWVDRNGERAPLSLPRKQYGGVRISPDIEQFVLHDNSTLWIADLDRPTWRPITDDLGGDYWPIWTPDGKRIIFNSDRYGGTIMNLYWMPADGSGEPERLAESEFHQSPQSLTQDGSVLAFTEYTVSGDVDIWMLPMNGDALPQPFVHSRYNESHPSFSPDGRWLAYASDESGRMEVYVRPYPGPGSEIQISTGGGWEPVWSPGGAELFYREEDGKKVMAVTFRPGSTVQVSVPELLFEGNFHAGHLHGRDYDLSPDGQRFLMIDNSESKSTATQINVVFNWFEELKRLTTSFE